MDNKHADNRTTVDILRDLLEHVRENEWQEKYTLYSCGCCGEWETKCRVCDACAGEYGDDNYRSHNPECKLAALILEAEAFLTVEGEICSKEPEEKNSSNT